MLKFSLHFLVAFALLLSPAPAQTTNAASTNAPAATAPTPAIAVANIITQSQSDTTQLDSDKASLDPDKTLLDVDGRLGDLKNQIDVRVKEDNQLFEGNASLSTLQSSQTEWESIADNLASAQSDVCKRVNHLHDLLANLQKMTATWTATLAANTTQSPAFVVPTSKEVLAQIADTTKAVNAHLLPLYDMQNRVAAQDKITQAGLDAVKKRIVAERGEFFKRNHPQLWNPAAFAQPAAGVVSQEKASLESQISGLSTYLTDYIGAALVHLLLLALLIGAFYWIRRSVHARCDAEVELRPAALVFDAPLATAFLLAILATGLLYPAPPRLFSAIAGAAALIPAVLLTRRFIDPENYPILYATVIAYLVDQVRFVATPEGIASRALFIAELLAVSLFILTALRSKHLIVGQGDRDRLKRITRFYLHLTFLVLVFAGGANVLGYTKLSVQVGDGMLQNSYLAVILYPTVRILDALTIGALSLHPIARFGMVRHHRDLIYANTSGLIRWIVFALWLIVALQNFSLLSPLVEHGNAFLWRDHSYFSFHFTLGAIIAFPFTIWLSFLLSRFIRFVLEEEIYPHMALSRGIPYAASTMVNYVILLFGFFAAIAATGAELSQFAFLAGAFGVGLGLGLQNIMNNFVSGIILLFERPIKVGDDIQIDATTMGRVERIGIRASVILLSNGSEMIVPNGNLISNPVTNWTLSNCERLIEIPVNVTSKVDPQHVQDLLTKIAAANQNVLKNPAPHTLLITFGAALNFKVRAWIDSEDEWMKVTSDLSIAINSALTKEGITVG